MKRYLFLFTILFSIGCNSSPAETTEHKKGEVEQIESKAATAISNSKEIAENKVSEKVSSDKGPLLTDNLDKKKPAVINAKEKPPKADTPTEAVKPQTPIKKAVENVIPAPALKQEVKPTQPKAQSLPPVEKIAEVIKEKEVVKVEPPKPEPKKVEKVEASKKITSVAHTIFDGLLKKNVSSAGKVNYKGLKSAETTLDKYIGTLEEIKVNDLSGRDEKMSFWINAYNAYTIKLILKNYPLKSITDLHGGKPWDVKWIKLDGRTLSLNNIENDILRPEYKDPRIHFAVNCAAKSCPALLNKAWTPSNLESSFATQTKKFVNNTSFNKISKKKIEVSKIFEWYGEDFGNLVNFLNKYSSAEINSDAKIEFVEYDWSLNE